MTYSKKMFIIILNVEIKIEILFFFFITAPMN